MSPWLQFALGACGFALVVLQLAAKLGWFAGKHEGQRGEDKMAVAQLALEVTSLRAWRHKVGEDPNDAVLKLLTLMEKDYDRRLESLERKVFNGGVRT